MIDSDRERRARLASVREELLAPVVALVGYGELLVEEARREDLGDLGQDLTRILDAARELLGVVDHLLDGAASGGPSGEDLESVQVELRVRLRTPLNTIMGYAELALEELDGRGGDTVRPDLEALLGECRRLISSLDEIVDLSRGAESAALAGRDPRAVSSMIANLVRTVTPPSPDSSTHEAGRILVVDDNASNRDILHRRLTRDGHRVRLAGSGREAFEILAVEDFDLVLLDLLMPDINGFEILVRIKDDDRLRDVPVIIISALQETGSVARCIEAGAEDYLPKTFDPVLLRARIAGALERKRWRDRERRYIERIEHEKAKHEALLRNILPGQIVTRLNEGEVVIADRVEGASVVFADLVGFTAIAARLSPSELIDGLNRIFSAFDDHCRRLKIEKIKTIGDAYMAAAGLPEPRPDHAAAAARLAFAMLRTLEEIGTTDGVPFRVRIGIDTGPVIAGVIGAHKFIYDIWGSTVNLASRLEAHGEPGRVHVSEATRLALGDLYDYEARGPIEMKGLGRIDTSFLVEREPVET